MLKCHVYPGWPFALCGWRGGLLAHYRNVPGRVGRTDRRSNVCGKINGSHPATGTESGLQADGRNFSLSLSGYTDLNFNYLEGNFYWWIEEKPGIKI
jgi:hypothetical protein